MGLTAALAFLLSLAASGAAHAQMWFPGAGQSEDLVPRFDANGDGKLDQAERTAARDWIRAQGPGRRTAYRADRPTPPRSTLADDLQASSRAAPPRGSELYDESVLRTIYLRFAAADWYDELADFYETGIEVPADLVVDGRVYPSVGVRFRGNSSYQMTGGSLKKPLNVSVDYEDPSQRIYGYRTLNLLNANTDPTFMREVLFSHIAGSYIPTPRACFVRLVINGEDWGVYVSAQQFNKDFTREWFGTTDGVRFKVPAGRGGGSLAYLGSEIAPYRRFYDIQSTDDPQAWQDLMRLCRTLDREAGQGWEEELDRILDVDGALWALALENVFIDGDGYLSRAGDYLLYQDPRGRFHVIPYDNNETFRSSEGGGPNSWPSHGLTLDPLIFAGSPARPLVSRLLAVPALRARYLSCVRTITEEWLSWEAIGPLVDAHRALIDEAVRADSKKLATYESFLAGATGDVETEESRGWRGRVGAGPSLRVFVMQRREYLLAHPEVRRASTATRMAAYVDPPAGDGTSPVLVNELMARNTLTVRDPQREHEDWIELYNRSGTAVVLTGMYLTDDERELRKWRIPAGVTIPAHGYLVIWADEDVTAAVGLHAGFKLSADGETVVLVDTDERGNRVLDAVRFGSQEADAALGRYPDGTGSVAPVRASPGKANVPR